MQLLRLMNDRLLTEIVDSPAFDLKCDVLCIGAGCAGVYAADAAARSGADVILLENDVTPGGMHILGNVRNYYYGFGGGSFEVDDAASANTNAFYFPADEKRIALLRRLKNSGVNLRCSCTPTAVFTDGNTVKGILAFDGEREISIGADMTIDATSDGYLIRMLPVRKQYGRAPRGKTAPFSAFLTFFDSEKFRSLNRDAGFVNPYDSEDFSRKTMLSHVQASDILLERQLLCIASHTGVREGLKFEGEDTLRYESVLAGQEPNRILFWAYSDLDIHGHLRALEEELFQTWWVISNLATVTLRIPVPTGAVIPKGWRGIATAGRCLSADAYMQNSVRMNRDMFRMGECVGTAAAMAVSSGGDLLAIDYDEYCRRVRAMGCFAGDEEKRFGFDYPHKNRPYVSLSFTPDETFHLLHTETPGPAFWTAYLHRENTGLANRIVALLSDNDLLCRRNAAIALGVMGDRRALDGLREIIRNRDCFYFKDCRRSNQFRSVIAACLLGRIGEPDDIPLLHAIVFDPEEFTNPMYHTLPPDYLYYRDGDRNFLYFDMITYAGAALVKIHLRHSLPTDALHESFIRLRDEGLLIRRIAPNCGTEETPWEETADFLNEMIRVTKP